MKGRWHEDVVRMLTNWAMWLAGDTRHGSRSPFPAYNLAAPGPRAGNVIPVLSGEAEDVNTVISTLPLRYQRPLQMHYCWPGRSDRSKAAACACALNTYKDRLDHAHELFAQAWYARRSKAA